MRKICIIYNPNKKDAVDYSKELAAFLRKRKLAVKICSAWQPAEIQQYVPDTDLVISVGGDGTILRSAKAIVPHKCPILGINLGRLGFMSEFTRESINSNLEHVLQGKGWIEQRAMLEINMRGEKLYALNDAFIGRRSIARLVSIECRVNGKLLTAYRADGLIVSTASGSTGYSLAAGGPILHPESRELILQPVSPHYSFDKTLVLPSDSKIKLKVTTAHEAMLSIDGQIEFSLNDGDVIDIKLSQHSARFLRLQPKSYFFATLDSKLNRKIV